MSLNPSEQRTYTYLQTHPDEERFWRGKVRAAAAQPEAVEAVVSRLERALWQYYLERSHAVPSFQAASQREGRARTSMRNLAELLLRLWTEPRPKPKPGARDGII